jgi:hypothetical protein
LVGKGADMLDHRVRKDGVERAVGVLAKVARVACDKAHLACTGCALLNGRNIHHRDLAIKISLLEQRKVIVPVTFGTTDVEHLQGRVAARQRLQQRNEQLEALRPQP